MGIESFSTIYQRACKRKGGEKALESMLSAPLSSELVAKIPDDRFLAAMTKQVFQSGFVWRVIEKKWPEFETVFFGFDIEKVLLMPDEMLEQKASDKRIVRNYKKVMTVRRGSRLGGNTGPYMLRALGVDTFLFSRDVEDYLRKNDIIDGGLTSKKSLSAANAAFARWHQESGRTLQEISVIIAFSWGTNQYLA